MNDAIAQLDQATQQNAALVGRVTTLSARIRDHKWRLVEIVKPPVCTERARHYTESYQANMDKPIVVRWRWRWRIICNNARFDRQ